MTCHSVEGKIWAGKKTPLMEYISTYNYVSHRGSNALLYHKIKGQAMSLCGKEPHRSNFLYFLFENSRQYSRVSELPVKFITTSCFV